MGYEVDIVATGAEAIDAVTSTPYAAVLMDCHMPVMDAFAATMEIRNRETDGSHMPVFAMTASAIPKTWTAAWPRGWTTSFPNRST